MNVPSLVPAKKGPQGFRSSQCTSRTEGNYLGLPDSYFIDGKSDGKESRPLLALHPSTFLHQSHDQSARPLPVLWVVVLLIQLQPILRVGPERVCKTQGRALETKASHQDIQSRIRYDCRCDAKNPRPTWEIPATASRVASHPAALVDRHGPAVPLVALQGVGRQVTQLQLCEVALEVFERHPEREGERKTIVSEGSLGIGEVLRYIQ